MMTLSRTSASVALALIVLNEPLQGPLLIGAALIVAGGGVIYSEATDALRRFVEQTGIPVGETQAGKGSLPYDHPASLGAVGVTGTFAFFQFTPSGLLYRLYPVTLDVVEAFQLTSTTWFVVPWIAIE